MAKKLLAGSELYAGKTFTVHNFIERKFVPNKIENKEPYIGFAGRLSKEKGIDLLAETAKLLPEYRFEIAGNGPDGDCLKGIDNVILKGFLTGSELTDFMANAKLLVVPSVWYENCPLSILEAQSMGVPVITMDNGGMAELVQTGKNGYLVSESTPRAVADVLKKCMDDAYYSTIKANCEEMSGSIIGVKEYCRILLEKYNQLKTER